MKSHQLIGVLIVAAFVAACTSAATSDNAGANNGDCFNVSMAQGYETVDRDTVRLDLGPGAEYDVDLEGAQCNTVEWAQRVAIELTPSSFVCVGDRVGQGEIHFREPTTRRRISCHIGEVRRVAEAPAS